MTTDAPPPSGPPGAPPPGGGNRRRRRRRGRGGRGPGGPPQPNANAPGDEGDEDDGDDEAGASAEATPSATPNTPSPAPAPRALDATAGARPQQQQPRRDERQRQQRPQQSRRDERGRQQQPRAQQERGDRGPERNRGERGPEQARGERSQDRNRGERGPEPARGERGPERDRGERGPDQARGERGPDRERGDRAQDRNRDRGRERGQDRGGDRNRGPRPQAPPVAAAASSSSPSPATPTGAPVVTRVNNDVEAPLARPSAEIDAGWGTLEDTPTPTPAPQPVVAERQPTPPEPKEARDPDGDDVFADLPLDVPVPPGTLANVAGVKFRDAGTIHEFDAEERSYKRGERVVVESERGPIVGTIAVASRRLPVLDPLRRILRPAAPADEGARDRNVAKEREAFLFCKQKIRERSLPMKLTRVEYPLSSGKVLFYFASDERIDFRDLVKDLAAKLHTRIEMRQIGARDEAKMVGGIGSCGRELCCSTWLPAFVPVSIKMAKDQGLVLNPSKVSGQCGRLKCCLVYEHDLYKEMRKTLPKVGKRVSTPAGDGKVVELDVLGQRVRVWFDEGGSESFPPDVITVLAPPPQLGKGGKLPVVSDDET